MSGYELMYDRSHRPIELWAAVLSASQNPHAYSEYDLESAIGLAMGFLTESAPPRVKCLALYVLGKSVLLLREHYPEWREWVAFLAILSGEWARVTGDDALCMRSESLFTDYVQLLKLPTPGSPQYDTGVSESDVRL